MDIVVVSSGRAPLDHTAQCEANDRPVRRMPPTQSRCTSVRSTPTSARKRGKLGTTCHTGPFTSNAAFRCFGIGTHGVRHCPRTVRRDTRRHGATLLVAAWRTIYKMAELHSHAVHFFHCHNLFFPRQTRICERLMSSAYSSSTIQGNRRERATPCGSSVTGSMCALPCLGHPLEVTRAQAQASLRTTDVQSLHPQSLPQHRGTIRTMSATCPTVHQHPPRTTASHHKDRPARAGTASGGQMTCEGT